MDSHLQWSSVSGARALAENEIHIWKARLDVSEDILAELEQVLSADERERAARLRSSQVSRRFIAGRSIIRNILARYLKIESTQVRFSYNKAGKPFLLTDEEQKGLCFNLTHSHNLALVAITTSQEIGIDLEYLRQEIDVNQVANNFFLPEELETLRNLTPELRRETFFKFWTVKEAYWKACGQDLGVTLKPLQNMGEEAFSLIETSPEVASYKLYCFAPELDYTGALAIPNELARRLYSWD